MEDNVILRAFRGKQKFPGNVSKPDQFYFMAFHAGIEHFSSLHLWVNLPPYGSCNVIVLSEMGDRNDILSEVGDRNDFASEMVGRNAEHVRNMIWPSTVY